MLKYLWTFKISVSSVATPGPPYALTVVEITKRHVELKWEPPKSDGGRHITKYVMDLL